MIQVRQGIFETNSSSTHVLTMCTDSDYQKWKDGELIYSFYDDELVPFTDEIKKLKEEDDEKEFLTYEEFFSGDMEYEMYDQTFTTPSGDKVVAFGYFGYDA